MSTTAGTKCAQCLACPAATQVGLIVATVPRRRAGAPDAARASHPITDPCLTTCQAFREWPVLLVQPDGRVIRLTSYDGNCVIRLRSVDSRAILPVGCDSLAQ